MSLFFATSTSGRFVKLKYNAIISEYTSVPNLTKQLFHSRLLDMRLVIANSALRASLAIYHLISNARSWDNCEIVNEPTDEHYINETAAIYCPKVS